MMTIRFRLITPLDIPTLHKWRNSPHISKWWDPPNPPLEECVMEYSQYMRPNSKVAAYIIQHNGDDTGYMQRWVVRDFPDYKPYVPDLDDASVGIDVFIGEASKLHQGIGTAAIRAFITGYVFNTPAVPACIIDPLPDNAAAIRAYEKAGFRYEQTFQHDGVGVYFMRLHRANWTQSLNS